jgi:uncharacterized protein YjdB
MVQVLRMTSIAILISAALVAAACGQSTTTASTVTAVAVTGTIPTTGTTSQFKATATMGDGTTQDVTTQSTWQSSNSAIATVTQSGVVTAVGLGTVTVQATYQNVGGLDQITIAQ